MFKEILIDHTSVHALRPFAGSADQLSVRANELLQFVENLLLADVVWICDTVTSETMHETMRYYRILLKHGIARTKYEGSVRIAEFNQEQILKAVTAAATPIKDTVARYGASDWRRLSGTLAYRMRPAGAQPVDFRSLAAIPFASQQAAEYIQTGLKEMGWKTAALAPLLSAPLHLWLQGLVATFPDPASPVYDTLNTVFRWRYNEQLAMILSGPEAQPIDYVPAIGRAKSIEYLSEYSWAARLRHIERNASEAITGRDDVATMFLGLGPTIDYPLPLFGAWAVSQLTPGCTLDHLIEKISELKRSPEIISVKRWLIDADTASICDFTNELRQRLETCDIGCSNKEDRRLKILNPWVWREDNGGAGSTGVSLNALRQTKENADTVLAVSTIITSLSHSDVAPTANTILARVSELLDLSRDELVTTGLGSRDSATQRAVTGAVSARDPLRVTSSVTSSQVSDSYVFRKCNGRIWEIRFPGDKGDYYQDLKGFAHFHELLRTTRFLTGAELLGCSPIPSNNSAGDRKRIVSLSKQLKREKNRLTVIEETLLHARDELSFEQMHVVEEEKRKINEAIVSLKQSRESLVVEQSDPSTAAAHAVRAAMTRALRLLRGPMPLLVAHIDHCRQRNSNSFRYDPGVVRPAWVLE